MSDIDEVRKRLERACIAGMDAEYVDDVGALLADHARLQALAVCCAAVDCYSREEIAEMAKAVQPAPAIDLEQFRPAVYALSSTATTKEEEAEVDRLLDLIDGQASPGCGACGDGCVTRGSCRVRDESPPCSNEQPSKGEPLWCLHILGPDDVHAAPSKEHAERAAERFNEIHGPVAASAGVMCRAVAAPWPHSPEAHASLVGAFETDCLRPTKGEGE